MPPDDFFDEDWEEPSQTQETAVTRPAPGAQAARPEAEPKPPPPTTPKAPRIPGRGRFAGRGPRRPGGGGADGDGPQLEYGRLAALGAVILVVVLVGYWALNRGGGGDPTKEYFTKVSAVLTQSDAIGKQFGAMLNQPHTKPAVFKNRLEAQIQHSQALLQQAEGIKPTSQLTAVHQYLLLALQYRINGLQCLADNVEAAAKQKPRAGARTLSGCAQRLLASDVIYSDSYANVASSNLRDAKIIAQVPTSRFLPAQDTSLVTAPGFAQVLGRLRPGKVTGLHGVNVVSVVAEPTGTTLVSGQSNQIHHFSTALAFKITVHNGGNFQEVAVKVRLAVAHTGQPTIKRTATIASIDKGATASVTISGIFEGSQAPQFSQPYTLTAVAGPVPGERNTKNNHLSYSVIFQVA